jgi:hypothetical protein
MRKKAEKGGSNEPYGWLRQPRAGPKVDPAGSTHAVVFHPCFRHIGKGAVTGSAVFRRETSTG